MSVVIQFFKELGPVRLAIAGFGLLFFIIFFAIFIFKVASKDMLVLYSNLELEDSNRIVQELESKHIPYELSAGGTTILVPEDQVLKMRVSMAQEGLPGKGSIVGYEIFDKEESLGSTSFLQNVKMLRALEGELVRTIESLEQVEKARVHLVIPKKELFSKERQEPRASVVLKLKGSRSLQKPEIDSISHLVASSVPDLDVNNITIVDSKGKSLKLGLKDDESSAYGGSANDERRLGMESKLKRTIEELLERTIGAGKVIANVNLEMNFDRTVSNIESYDPDGSVLRSEQAVEEKERTPVGGEDSVDVSVANNVPGGGTFNSGDSGNFATVTRTDDTRNYEISKTVKNVINDSGTIHKLSVAVLVDGTYAKNTTDNSEVYQPRTQDEINNIENIVKVAVGYNEGRGDQIQVINMPFVNDIDQFQQEDLKEWIKEELPAVLQTLVVAAVTLLIFIVVIRPIAIRAFDIRKVDFHVDPTVQDQLGLAPKVESDQDVMLNITKTAQQSATTANAGKVNEAVNEHPQETLMLIRRWLNEEGQ